MVMLRRENSRGIGVFVSIAADVNRFFGRSFVNGFWWEVIFKNRFLQLHAMLRESMENGQGKCGWFGCCYCVGGGNVAENGG